VEQRYYVRLGSEVHAPRTAEQLRRLRDAGKLPSSAEFSSDKQVWSRSLPAEDRLPHAPPPHPPVAIADRYDVFVSYCRDDGATVARLLVDKLTAEGYRVFLDVEELGSGSWSQELEARIHECPDFVIVLTAAYISRLRSPNSVIHREVATALQVGRNVVPVLLETMPPADQLPAAVAALPDANGIRFVHEYISAVVTKLCALLRSARLTGPERLRTGEAQPRAIVCCLGMLLGTIQGAQNGAMAGAPVGPGIYGPIPATVNALVWAVAAFGILLPVALILLAVGSKKGIRRDRLYLGPWVPFWLLFIPVVMTAASAVPTAIFLWLRMQSFFWGGIIGMAIGVALTALLSLTNTWGTIRAAFPGRR
jgi:hypothetical protein